MDHPLTSLDWKLLLAVPAIPLAAFVLQIFFGKRLPRKGDWLPTAGMFVVMCITVRMLFVALGAAGHGPFFHESVREGGPVFGWFYQAAEKDPSLNKNKVARVARAARAARASGHAEHKSEPFQTTQER